MVKTLSSDQECLSGLALLLQDITNGTLPRSIKPFLLSSNLIGLDKNQGQSVRPIAIGEVFYRIAAFRAQQAVRGVACEKLHPIQLGIGTPNGCESIVHNLQHVLEQPQQPVASLTIDFANAFNSCLKLFVQYASLKLPLQNRGLCLLRTIRSTCPGPE